MKVQKITQTKNQTNSNNKPLTFGARVNEILEASEKALERNQICPGKAAFLENITDYFTILGSRLLDSKDTPKEVIYNLGEKNPIPDFFTKKNARKIWQKIDDRLNYKEFQCSEKSDCTCGQGKSSGEFARELLKKIGVNEPNIITIEKPEKRIPSLFGILRLLGYQ